MSSIQSRTTEDNYEIEIKSASGHTVLADEPKSAGGQNKGMAPDEFLIAGLAACISATLKMYAQRKEWNLKAVNTNIKFEDGDKPGDLPRILSDIELVGELDEKQRERLMIIAGRCPIHKMLEGGMKISTTEINASIS